MIAKWGQPSEESKTKGGDICDSLLFEKDKKITTYITTLIDKHLRNVTSRDRLVKDCMRVVLEKNQNKMMEMYIRGRKKGISIVYLSQSFYRIPKTIRSNCNYFVILKLSGKRDLNLIMSEFESNTAVLVYSWYKKPPSTLFRRGARVYNPSHGPVITGTYPNFNCPFLPS